MGGLVLALWLVSCAPPDAGHDAGSGAPAATPEAALERFVEAINHGDREAALALSRADGPHAYLLEPKIELALALAAFRQQVIAAHDERGWWAVERVLGRPRVPLTHEMLRSRRIELDGDEARLPDQRSTLRLVRLDERWYIDAPTLAPLPFEPEVNLAMIRKETELLTEQSDRIARSEADDDARDIAMRIDQQLRDELLAQIRRVRHSQLDEPGDD